MWAFLMLLMQVLSCPNRARASVFTLTQNSQYTSTGGVTTSPPKNKHPAASTRIINGRDAQDGRYPYFVTLESPDGYIFCGGSLVAPNAVLSAAHCAEAHPTHISIGRKTRYESFLTLERYEIVSEIQHPQYQEAEFYATFDFMLLRFNGISTTPPVTLNWDETMPANEDEKLTVMGFGTTAANLFTPPLKLQEVEVDYVPNEVCQTAHDPYSGYVPYQGLILPDMICAASPGRDSCSGDSGGPLIIPGKSAEDDIQVGVVSWGFSCAHPSYPGVYGRVSHVLSSWIEGTICDLTYGVVDDTKRIGCLNKAGVLAPASSSSPTMMPSIQTSSPQTLLPMNSPPTDSPTVGAAEKVTTAPTSRSPTSLPTSIRTLSPMPLLTSSPTDLPTATPRSTNPPRTVHPTKPPTTSPTKSPTTSPTKRPTPTPTKPPTPPPSVSPTPFPSESPSLSPSLSPSEVPSAFPSFRPTLLPSKAPSIPPTSSPSLGGALFREIPNSSGYRLRLQGVAVLLVATATGFVL